MLLTRRHCREMDNGDNKELSGSEEEKEDVDEETLKQETLYYTPHI
jgi:hypothetical protein